MSLDSAIDNAPGLYISKKLRNAKDNDNADAATLLKMLKRYRSYVLFLHILVSVISFGIVPLIYFLGKRHLNKSLSVDKQEHTNFFTYAFYESAESIAEFEALVNEDAPESSENESQDTSQNPEEHQDSQGDDSSSEAVIPADNDEEGLYRFAQKCHHPLGPRLGGRIIVEDPLHKDLECEYGERMSATILDNGNILACDINTYTWGGEDRAIGIFDQSKKLLKPLFRYMQSNIENKLRALEYKPNEFVYFYKRFGKNILCFNNGRNELSLSSFGSSLLIPLHFEFTKEHFEICEIVLVGLLDGKNNRVDCRYDFVSTIDKKNHPLTAKIVSDHIGTMMSSENKYSIEYNCQVLFDHVVHKGDDPAEISAIAYSASTSFLYLANVENKLYRAPLKLNEHKMLERNGDVQRAEIIEGKLITKIAVNLDGRYIVVLREDATYEVYLSDGDFKTKLLTVSSVDPAVQGEILDIKFLNDDIIFATTQKVVVVSKEVLKVFEKAHQTLEEEDKKKSLTKEENAALRKHHTASQSKDKTFKAAQKLERLRSTILSNGDIVACDKAVFEGNTESYCLRVLHSQYALSVDKPIVNDMQKGRMIYTPNPTAAEFIPFHQNDRLVFFVRDQDQVLMLNAEGHTIGGIIVPINDSQLLIPFDYIMLALAQTARVIEISKDQILIHLMTVGEHGIVQNAIVLRQLWNPVKAATCTQSNKRLYYVEGEQFKFITLDTIYNPKECGSTLSLQNVTKIAVSENGLRLATAKADGTITLYDMEEFNTNKSGDIKYLSEIKIVGGVPLDIRFVEDDKDLLIATNTNAVRINNVEENFDKTPSYDLK